MTWEILVIRIGEELGFPCDDSLTWDIWNGSFIFWVKSTHDAFPDSWYTGPSICMGYVHKQGWRTYVPFVFNFLQKSGLSKGNFEMEPSISFKVKGMRKSRVRTWERDWRMEEEEIFESVVEYEWRKRTEKVNGASLSISREGTRKLLWLPLSISLPPSPTMAHWGLILLPPFFPLQSLNCSAHNNQLSILRTPP